MDCDRFEKLVSASRKTKDLNESANSSGLEEFGNRNALFLIIGALIVVVGVLGYNLYQDRRQP